MKRMHALYVSHTGMSEPLGRSQVVPYLQGLARAGWSIEIVAFEPTGADPREIAAASELLRADGIVYRWTRRSPRHGLGVKIAESMRAFAALVRSALARRPRIVHARSYLPGAVARALAFVSPGTRFLFDCRGLLGDEYADFGVWRRDSFRYRLIKAAEKRLFGQADGVVTLTDRLRRWLCDEARMVDASTPLEVIPCCVDLSRFQVDGAARTVARARLGAGDRFVLAYAGSLGSCYCDDQMAELFAAVRRHKPALFTVFTRCDTTRLRTRLRALGVADSDVEVRSAPQPEMATLLSGADAAVAFIEPRFSKIGSSPVKLPEYLGVGLRVVANRGVGDQDEMITSAPDTFIDGGNLDSAAIEAAAARLAALPPLDDAMRARAHRLAAERFSLELGVSRYRRIYDRLA